ncbi:MAG: TlpA disulfide reductase family protein [Vicinamibacterales bacterium]
MKVAIVLLLAVLATGASDLQPVVGRWDAIVVVNGLEIPFRFDITAQGTEVKGSFFNGDRRITSTRSRFENGVLLLSFDQYASRLQVSHRDGQLSGEYQRPRGVYPFRATRVSTTPAPAAGKAPSIDGTWIVAAQSKKGESAWRFIVKQKGAGVSATILRVDGDTGTLTGSYRDGRFLLSHFSGARPLLLEVTPQEDGSLSLSQNGQPALAAARENAPRAKRIGKPTDPARHTSVKNPGEPFRFSFPDLDGRLVSNTDLRFRGKVVLVNISGSWCPNCHDEAPFLAALYRKYQSKGLEVVALSFEEADQLLNPTRLRAFIAEYGITYPVLVAGEPEQLNEKIPQAENLNAFPTTFILGRDGRVRTVHAGFPSPGSGVYYQRAERTIIREVERLLVEPTGTY